MTPTRRKIGLALVMVAVGLGGAAAAFFATGHFVLDRDNSAAMKHGLSAGTAAGNRAVTVSSAKAQRAESIRAYRGAIATGQTVTTTITTTTTTTTTARP